ncbi:two-component system, OmpR family, response regulator ResD [Carboxydocella sporoproducens DSM 16521]|uniref:Stage 0 sporulation protein A homolog n=2 Tax=Carboxydocella TaxID=178898 RepID=A0A1T4L8S5_9FIRM|nr:MULTISPECIES: response regulator transcription factor [Carboxydocella]AVX19901.1 two-component system, OmpR family, response regulator ResD [Carboxydocella thermautotrophica]AVX30310.1 two-component system, OmpR family, response regulator ResD [Carboxydocella thermautotrophica]SJZ51155.1 two-component system, OmpR family, response regulator ResD [Carboxydocella sporoproducens DSM 16521]
MARVLVVDDEERIRRMLRLFLEKEGLEVLEGENGQQAVELVRKERVDLVVLDLMMPVMDGWEACQQIRSQSQVPIIMLTARGEEEERIHGFELGADDYVVKPFSPKELVLRIKALLRRSLGSSPVEGEKKGLSFPGLTILPESRKILVDQQEVALTPLEYDLLHFLARHQGRVFTREQLLEKVWGYDYFGDLRTVDTHVKRVREKLGKISTEVAGYVVTVWGVGYKFEVKK